MSFNKDVSERALVDSGRCCCLCHKFCGIKMELHHIKQKADGGEDTYENCIPLCFDCHAEVKAYNSRHPKGRQYKDSELVLHRNNWYEKLRATNQNSSSNFNYRKLDIEIYNKIKKMLNSINTIDFLRTNNFAGISFKRAHTIILDDFKRECEFNPEFEFIDADLEAMKGKLYSDITVFISVLSSNTWTLNGNMELSSVPKEWEYEQPDRFWEVVNELHEMTTNITDDYDNLVRLTRRKLVI